MGVATQLVVALAIMCAVLLAVAFFLLPSRSNKRKGLIQIVVLGDLGRSPRMQYHALSIAKYGGHVDMIGYLGTIQNSCL